MSLLDQLLEAEARRRIDELRQSGKLEKINGFDKHGKDKN